MRLYAKQEVVQVEAVFGGKKLGAIWWQFGKRRSEENVSLERRGGSVVFGLVGGHYSVGAQQSLASSHARFVA